MADIDLKPTEEMAENAARGLALRKKYNRGGTAVGVARARDLKNRTDLSPETVKRMHSYFERHEVDKKGEGWGEDSAGYIAWLLWGGDAGRSWAARKAKELERKETNGMTKAATKIGARAQFAKSPLDKARELIAKARQMPNAPMSALTHLEQSLATQPHGTFVEQAIADLQKWIKDNTVKPAPKPKSAAKATPSAPAPRAPKPAAEATVLPEATQRGLIGRTVDRARAAVSTLTTKTVDPTAPKYAQTLAEAKHSGLQALANYKAAAAAHDAAIARLDKYVDHASKSIAGAQSAKDVAHFLAAIQAATRTRAVAARSMPTPFSRPGSNQTFAYYDDPKLERELRKASKMLDTIEEQINSNNKDLALANYNKVVGLISREGNSDDFRKLMLLKSRLKAMSSRPGAKAKMGLNVSRSLKDEMEYVMGDDGEVTVGEALKELMQDCNDKNHSASEFKKELQDIGIRLGVYKPQTKSQISQVVTNKGKAYSFKRGDVYYIFESWNPVLAIKSFSRPGAKAKFGSGEIDMMLNMLASQVVDQKDLARKNAKNVAEFIYEHGTASQIKKFLDLANRVGLHESMARPGAKAKMARWESTLTKKHGKPIEEYTARLKGGLFKIEVGEGASGPYAVLYRWDDLRGEERIASGNLQSLMRQAESMGVKEARGVAAVERLANYSRPGAKATAASDDALGKKIALLIREGYPRDQAAAIAYDMKRRGEL